ncbi:hypothetical protein PSTG_19762, partial [Puccinia striiformis f. sp. tritici PST-78]
MVKGVATFRDTETERWSRKVILDLKNLATAHDADGVLMLVKHSRNGPEVVSGGSALGVQFLDMFCPRAQELADRQRAQHQELADRHSASPPRE